MRYGLPMATESSVRRYRGMTAEERTADRRRRLIDSGTTLIGENGYAAVTISDLCASAGVTARNFYDHFEAKEDLLLAVYEATVAEHAAVTLEALAAAPGDD